MSPVSVWRCLTKIDIWLTLCSQGCYEQQASLPFGFRQGSIGLTTLGERQAVTAHHPTIYAPLRLAPGRSWRLAVGLTGVYTLAVLVTAGLPLPTWSRLALASVLAIGAWWEMAVHVLHSSPRAILEALWDGQGNWTLYLASGAQLNAELERDSLVTLPLVVLNFRTGSWRRHSIILTSDNCDPEQLRQLRVRLRLEYGRTSPDREPGF
jgi:toxin CptA